MATALLKNYYNNKKIKTILSKDSVLDGKLKFEDSVKINGKFSGEIHAEGFLLVGEGAVITANITALSVVVEGTVNGDIYASEKVDMLPTGRVYGNIKTKKIKISDGVIFNGKCEILK